MRAGIGARPVSYRRAENIAAESLRFLTTDAQGQGVPFLNGGRGDPTCDQLVHAPGDRNRANDLQSLLTSDWHTAS